MIVTSLNCPSRQDKLERGSCEDAREADTKAPSTMPKTTKLRDETKYRLLSALDPETYAGLKANIAVNGVQVPIVRDDQGHILDGFAREQIARELGYECPSVTVRGLTEQEKRSQVRALNLARRHLDHHAKTQIIADELKENPDRSNRWIAKSLGVDDKAVARVRADMQATAALPQLGFTLGSDGKFRPATWNQHGSEAHVSQNGRVDQTIRMTNGGPLPLDEQEILLAAEEIKRRRGLTEPDRKVVSNGSNHQPFFRHAASHVRSRASNQETPPGVARFLFDLISPKYEVMRILDPCAGNGALTRPWRGRRVIAFEIERGKDFFSCPERIACDLVLCNPPFNQELDAPAVYKPEQFLRRIMEVVPSKTPIALIAPMQ